MGWMHSVPEPKVMKGAVIHERKSRLQAMREQGITEVDLPPVPSEAAYLWDHFIEAGLAGAGGEGPIAWAELGEYQRLVGIDLTPWEARTLRRLSCEYVAERSAGRDPQRPAPWVEVSDRQRAAVGRALSTSLRAAAMAQRKEPMQ